MSYFILPALLALIIKLAVLRASWRWQFKSASSTVSPEAETTKNGEHGKKDVPLFIGLFTTLVLIMAGHNIAELLFYLEYQDGATKESVLRWYYLMTVLSSGAMVMYAKSVSRVHHEQSTANRVVNTLVVLSALTLAGLFMFSDLLVAGAQPIGYSMTADRGQLYWIFFAYSVLCFLAVLIYLSKGYLSAKSHHVEIQCGYTLVAMLPIIVTSLSLIGLMLLGYEVNAALVMPLATAAFLVISLRGEGAHRMFDIRRYIPLSLENRTANQIMEVFSEYAQDKCSYRDALTEIERMLVLHKHEKHEGNVSSTASSMDMPRSSLYSIFRRLDIDLGDLKEEKQHSS